MNKMAGHTAWIVGMAGGVLGYLFGEFDVLLKGLMCLVILDYITGVLRSIYNRTLSSRIGLKGILKKTAVFIIVAVANVLQMVFDNKIPLRETVIVFYITNEAVSIIENAQGLIAIPDKIRKMLDEIRKKDETDKHSE